MNKVLPEWVCQSAYNVGATLCLNIAMTPRPLFTCILFILFPSLLLNVSTLTLHIDDFIETIFVSLIYSCVSVHLLILVLRKESISVLVEQQLTAFKSFPKDSLESKVVEGFVNRVVRINLCIFIMLMSSLVSFFGYPVVSLLLSSKSFLTIPLPFGRVPFDFTSNTNFCFFYILSSMALLAAASMYTCWYVTFVFSSLHISTCLKLLVVKVRKLDFALCPMLDDIPEDFDAGDFAALNLARRLYVKKEANELLREILQDHIQIMK